MKKRITIGIIVGAAVFAAVFGLAAALDVNSDTLGAGSDDVVSCSESVDVAYTTLFGTTEYEVDTVTVSGIDAGCVGATLSVTILDGAGDQVGTELTATVAGTEVVFTDVGISAEKVEDIHAALTE
jgi:hypothetical protein